MQFQELQKKVLITAKKYSKKYKIKIDQDFALLKLYEEVGELAQAILIHREKCRPEKYLNKKESKKELAKELADVIGLVIINANLLKINLEKAIIKKWISQEWNNKK